MFLQTVKSAIERAEKDQYERQNSLLTVMVMCSLFVEAMCNAVGSRIVSGWEDYRLSSWGRPRLICAQVSAEFDPGKEPWQSLRWLLKFRNDFAHAKPEVAESDRALKADEWDDMRRGRSTWTPISKLESQLTLEVARAMRFTCVGSVPASIPCWVAFHLRVRSDYENAVGRSRKTSVNTLIC